MAKISVYIENTENNLRCVQACFRMIMHSLTGKDPGQEKADELTGFREGHGTWQFKMLVSFAESGFNVIDHEKFDFNGFAKNPEETIKAQAGDAIVAEKNIADTDIESEKKAIEECLNHPNILLKESIPTIEDLNYHLNMGRYVLCAVNSLALDNKSGHTGHMVIVEKSTMTELIVHDPGIPPRFNRTVDINTFKHAWMNPVEEMANLIVVYT